MKNKNSNVSYYLKTYLLAFIGFPFVVCIVAIFIYTLAVSASSMFDSIPLSVVSSILLIPTAFFSAWILVKKLPVSFKSRYLPALIHLTISLVLWAAAMIISGGFYGHRSIIPLGLFQIGFLPSTLYLTLLGELSQMVIIPICYDILFLLFFLLLERKSKNKPPIEKKFVKIFSAIVVVCISVGGTILIVRSQSVLHTSYGFDYGNGYSSVDLYNYDILNEDNKLPRLSTPSTFIITDPNKMPVLDGAEAAYPVYSAFANACYEGIDRTDNLTNANELHKEEYLKDQKVTFTNTIYAFERLLNGEVDIFFGAEPSKAQKNMAAKNGKELVLTPIGKEAFVFFVGINNITNGLSTEQIKQIYSGKTKNWADINDTDEKIWAFQRPENSGSQTIMQKLMGTTKLAKPLKEERISGMGGAYEKVADYRNYPGAIGYSFRFFTTGMVDSSNEIKLLNIEGIEPSEENIRSGKYPYVVNLYAITLKDNKLDTIDGFLEFMQGEQGQKLVSETGYITE